ncbi:MAG: MFS transporter [Bacteroidetes bacterium]|nr:MAG: MFS transporter [Bacteroidota bacterium]
MIARAVHFYVNSFRGLSRGVWLLALVMLINRSGTMVIPFLTLYLTQKLDFTLGQAGLIMGFFGAGSIVGGWLGGFLTDRIGYYKVQLYSFLASGFMWMLLLFTKSFWSIAIAVFFTSVVADAFRPANMVAVGVYSREENRTRSISLIRMAINLGWSVGPALGGLLIKLFGYHWLFILDGATCFLAGVFLAITLPEKEKPPTEDASPQEEESHERHSPWKDPLYLVFILSSLGMAIAFLQFLFTLPVYLKEDLLYSEDQIGLLMALNGVLIAVLEMPLIYFLEARRQKLFYIAFGTLLIGLAYLTLALSSWWGFVLLCFILLTLGETVSFPFHTTFALERGKAASRGKYMGLYSMMWSVAVILAPMAGMQIAQFFGFGTLWYVAVGLTLLGTLGYALVSRLHGSQRKATPVRT